MQTSDFVLFWKTHMIHRNEPINSAHELNSSLTSSSGLIYRNELDILEPVEFADILAVLFQYDSGNSDCTFTSSF
jgi:hypothetical protein